MFFLQTNYHANRSLNWTALAQPGGGCTYCVMQPSTKSVRDKKVAGCQNPGAPTCKYVIGLHTLLIH